MDTVPRKKTVRKVVNKQATPKAVVKRVSKSTPIKKITKTNSASRTKVVSSKKNEPINDGDEVVSFIPGNLTLRLKEKKALYEAWYQNNAEAVVAMATKGAGYTFIFLGLLATLATWLPLSASQSSLVAAVLCGDDGCDNEVSTTQQPLPETITPTTTTEPTENQTVTTTDTDNQTTSSYIKPAEVRFLNIPTVVAGKNTEIVFSVLNTKEHKLFVTSPVNGEKKEIKQLLKREDARYTYLIPTVDLPSGEYRATVYTLGLDNSTKANFLGPRFLVPFPPKTLSTEDTTTNSTDDDSLETVETVTTTEDDGDESKVSSTTESTADDQEDTKEDLLTTTPSSETFILSLQPGLYSNTYKVLIKSPHIYDVVELYARNENSTQRLFLGVATKNIDGWVYWFDSSKLPIGSYRIIANALINKEVKRYADVQFENKILLTETKTEQTYEDEITETKNIIKATELNEENSDITTIRQTYAFPPENQEELKINEVPTENVAITSQVEVPIIDRDTAKELLSKKKEAFNVLFSRYASALQTEDSTLMRLAENALNEEVSALMKEHADSESKINIEIAAQEEVKKIKKHVERVEGILKERTSQKSAVDSDSDGISDFDEQLLYGTDPNNPDTDGDGVIDGVEIMGGYNPLDEKAEAVIRFNSPKEVSYVNEELLKVEAVSPILEYEDENSVPVVQSEIRGFGLPNSFVTLYIFSTPTVVTLKTNDDGSFAYVFTKELEDGEHEVYVALTDNTGDIVVRSNPLKFVKTAEAFSYVDAENETAVPVVQQVESNVSSTFKVAAAMGVVSLGLILILLGQTLRSRKPEEVVV